MPSLPIHVFVHLHVREGNRDFEFAPGILGLACGIVCEGDAAFWELVSTGMTLGKEGECRRERCSVWTREGRSYEPHVVHRLCGVRIKKRSSLGLHRFVRQRERIDVGALGRSAVPEMRFMDIQPSTQNKLTGNVPSE